MLAAVPPLADRADWGRLGRDGAATVLLAPAFQTARRLPGRLRCAWVWGRAVTLQGTEGDWPPWDGLPFQLWMPLQGQPWRVAGSLPGPLKDRGDRGGRAGPAGSRTALGVPPTLHHELRHTIQHRGGLRQPPSLGLPAFLLPQAESPPSPEAQKATGRGREKGARGKRGSRGRALLGGIGGRDAEPFVVAAREPQQAAREHRLSREERAPRAAGPTRPGLCGTHARLRPQHVSADSRHVRGGWPGSVRASRGLLTRRLRNPRRPAARCLSRLHAPRAPHSPPACPWEGASRAGARSLTLQGAPRGGKRVTALPPPPPLPLPGA